MKNVKFEKYIAAVKMANIASNGSGDLNCYDHVAKDLHEEGFDAEEVPDWKAIAHMNEHWDEIEKLAREGYIDNA
jgi:hypothetical protein